MIEAYMQVDLNNPLAVKYHQVALKSFERVKDIFHINVVQCVTPDTLLDLPFSDKKTRSPQEKASICSQYRMMKRISQGERLWIMEHDAYLIPENESVFRMIMSKYEQMLTCNIGIAMECYTAHPRVANLFCDYVENDPKIKSVGPMGILHDVTDKFAAKHRNKAGNVYWPKFGQDNKTGLHSNVSMAHRKPFKILEAPVTQLIDINHGTTVTDRPKNQVKNFYTPDTHPNFHFIDLETELNK